MKPSKKKKLSTCFRALGKHFDGSFSPKRATKTSKIGKFPPFIHPPHQFLHPNTHLGCMLALRVPGISRDPDQHKAVTEDEWMNVIMRVVFGRVNTSTTFWTRTEQQSALHTTVLHVHVRVCVFGGKWGWCSTSSFHIHRQHNSALPPAASLPNTQGQTRKADSSARLKPVSEPVSLQALLVLAILKPGGFEGRDCGWRRAEQCSTRAGTTTSRACASMRHTFVYFNPRALFRAIRPRLHFLPCTTAASQK